MTRCRRSARPKGLGRWSGPWRAKQGSTGPTQQTGGTRSPNLLDDRSVGLKSVRVDIPDGDQFGSRRVELARPVRQIERAKQPLAAILTLEYQFLFARFDDADRPVMERRMGVAQLQALARELEDRMPHALLEIDRQSEVGFAQRQPRLAGRKAHVAR